MLLSLTLDTASLKEAINCYIKSRIVNAHTYDISVAIVAGRGSNESRASVNLTRKGEFSHLDSAIKDSDMTIDIPTMPEETADELEESPAYMDETSEEVPEIPAIPEEAAVPEEPISKPLPEPKMKSLFGQKK